MSDKIALTKPQINKLLKYKGVQLQPSQIGTGIKLHADFPMKHRKALAKAHKAQKGMRLKFSPEELVAGSGFWDWLKGAANTIWEKGFKPVVENVVKPIYKAAKPIIRPALKAALPTIATAVGGPAGAVLGSTLAPQAVDVLGDATGAFGVGRGRVMRSRGGAMLSDNSATMMAPQHPVFGYQPQFKGHDIRRVIDNTSKMGGAIQIDPRQIKNVFVPPRGSGFKPAGYGY